MMGEIRFKTTRNFPILWVGALHIRGGELTLLVTHSTLQLA